MTALEIIRQLAQVYTVDTDQHDLIRLVKEAQDWIARMNASVVDSRQEELDLDFKRYGE